MAKCCSGKPWNSFINGAEDGSFSVVTEDENTGDITGTHHGPIRNGNCKNKQIRYEVTKDGVDYEYKGHANNDCTKIDGKRRKLNSPADKTDKKGSPPPDEEDVWVATKGGGTDDKPEKPEKEKEKNGGRVS